MKRISYAFIAGLTNIIKYNIYRYYTYKDEVKLKHKVCQGLPIYSISYVNPPMYICNND